MTFLILKVNLCSLFGIGIRNSEPLKNLDNRTIGAVPLQKPVSGNGFKVSNLRGTYLQGK